MSKDNKNTDKNFFAVKTIVTIIIIAFVTYAIMAVINHFSLNFEFENYAFKNSLVSIFDTDTAIFKFFMYFMILNFVWISIALSIRLINRSIVNKK